MEENKKESKKVAILLMIVLFLLGIILGYASSKLLNKDDDKKDNKTLEKENKEEKEKENKEEKEKEKEEEKIVLSDQEIKKYLSYVPFDNGTIETCANPFDDCPHYYDDAYSGNKETIDKINKEILLFNAYVNVPEYKFKDGEERPVHSGQIEGYDGKVAEKAYKKSDVEKYIKDAYNININDLPTKISIPGGIFYLSGDYYLALDTNIGTYIDTKNNKNINYDINDNDLIINEEAIFIPSNYPIGVNYKVYANTNNLHSKVNALVDMESRGFNKNYDDILSNLKYTKFKHTFKKNDSGYYWYSTEVVD